MNDSSPEYLDRKEATNHSRDKQLEHVTTGARIQIGIGIICAHGNTDNDKQPTHHGTYGSHTSSSL